MATPGLPHLLTLAPRPLFVLAVIGTLVGTHIYKNGHSQAAELPEVSMEQQLLDVEWQIHLSEKRGATPELRLKRTEQRLQAALCAEGQKKYCPLRKVVAKNVDIDKLALAVAYAETSNCTTGTGKSKNNCFGIGGVGRFKVYETPEDSFQDFKILWVDKYGDRFPTLEDAKRYAGSEGSEWLKTVSAVYSSLE